VSSECWVVTDGAAGNRRQALALAECFSWPVRELVLKPRAPWSWLAPRLVLGGRLALSSGDRARFTAPWPRIAIGCGRAAALLTRQLHALSNGQTYTAQILDPRIDQAHWDVVIAPRHDGLDGPHTIATLGSLNPVDDAWLADGRESCPALADLPGPRIGVLLGGPRRGIPFDEAYADRLLAGLLARRKQEGGSLMLLASRRTPPAFVERLRQRLGDVPGLIWSGEDDGRNPYPGVLGWADRLVVTPDSVNMLSEACAVGCPVHTLVVAPLPDRLATFHQSLREAGLLHDIEAMTPPRQMPLRETSAIADELRRRMDARLTSQNPARR
jgi:mitochondrial fission protein ELM1